MEESIQKFLDNYNYDVRRTHDARWIDQKCTIDVICVIADCILQFTNRDLDKEFTIADIWHSPYAIENVQDIFQKPNPKEKAKREYDKWFGQPIKLFSYSRLLNHEVRNNRYYYKINNADILDFISIRERNAFLFLNMYIEKVLRDSELYYLFEEYFKVQTKQAYMDLKSGFAQFTIKYTPINGEVECNRIFIKVLNPLACKNRKRGTVQGMMSKDEITYDMLLYNQKNWRDAQKPKGLTRKEYDDSNKTNNKFTEYKIQKAKKLLKQYNDNFRQGKTEVFDERHIEDSATQMHHIFPSSDYPRIAAYLENLIALTPSQHYIYAHPNNNTQIVDRDYQYTCLIAKAGSIKDNLENIDKTPIYDFDDYKYVLNVGLDTNKFSDIADQDFDDIIRLIDVMFCNDSKISKVAEDELYKINLSSK